MPRTYRQLRLVTLLVGCCLAGMVLTASADEQSECARPVDTTFDDALLTRDEKIEILNQRFYDELARFEECFNANTNSASGGAAAGGQGGGGGGASGSQAFSAAGESLPVANIQGTELPEPEPVLSSAVEQDSTAMANGKLPEELETADNDAVLLEQIRQAAIAEEDPALKEKLWQEYNRRQSGQSDRAQSTETPQVNNTLPSTSSPGSVATEAVSEALQSTGNDNGFAEQIRQAAIAEQDPAMKEKLWQEYNRRSSNQGNHAQSTEIPQVDNTLPTAQPVESTANETIREPANSSDNGSELLEQIRQAAIAEQDPGMKEKLWQEYNKRKAAQNGGS